MQKLLAFLAASAFALLAGCGGNNGSTADPPADFRVVPGDGSAIVSWTAEPDVDYWIFFGPGANINTGNWATTGGSVIPNAISPRIITGLANGSTYSFTINGRRDRGPGGPGAPTQVITPMQAGANWEVGTPLGSARLSSIAAGSLATGFTLATVSASGAIYTSVNLGPMTERTNPVPGTALNAVWYGLLGFVAGGANGTLLRSIDGTNWTTLTSGTTATIHGGAASAVASYVAVGAGGLIVSSNDATSWTTRSVGSNDFYAATHGANRFIAVGAAGTIYSSVDGSNWGSSTSTTDRTLRGVAYGVIPSTTGGAATNLYVAVGDSGTVLRSEDASTWTAVTPFTTADLLGITYGGRFVAVGAGGVIFTSTDGLAWESRVSNTTADLASVARQLSGYTAVGTAGTNVSTF